MSQSDEKLLDALADDRNRIADIIDAYGDLLLGRLESYARDRSYGNSDVQDVVQESFLRLFDPNVRAAILRAGGLLLPYLTKYGRWRLDDVQRNRTSPLRPEQGGVAEPPDDDEEADIDDDDLDVVVEWRFAEAEGDEASAAGVAELVVDALLQLSVRDRDLLTFRYFESYSEAEIATLLGSKQTTIKKALHDARRRLKHILETEGFNVRE